MLRTIFYSFVIIASINGTAFAQSKGGHWKFENNGEDTAEWDSFNNSGVPQNQAVYSSVSPLQEGTYYLLTENSANKDYFKIEDENDLDFNNEDIAISVWIYPNILNDVHFIINKGFQDTNPKTTNYSIRIANNKKLEFLIRDSNNQAQKVASSFTIPENEWTFIAVFYDFVAQKVYMWNKVSENAVDTLDFQQNFFPNDAPLAIGGWANTDSNNQLVKGFKGRIDDVRISGRIDDILSQTLAVEDVGTVNNSNNSIDLSIYPNPASSSQNHITFNMQHHFMGNEPVDLRIYNIIGQEVYNNKIYTQQVGNNIYRWDLRDNLNNHLGIGTYFIQMKIRNRIVVNKFLIIK